MEKSSLVNFSIPLAKGEFKIGNQKLEWKNISDTIHPVCVAIHKNGKEERWMNFCIEKNNSLIFYDVYAGFIMEKKIPCKQIKFLWSMATTSR